MESPDPPSAGRDAESWKNKGDASFQEGNYGDAIECYKKAIGIDPVFVKAWNNLGYTYLKTGDTENALTCSRAIQSLQKKTDTQPETPNLPKPIKEGFFAFFLHTLVGILTAPKKDLPGTPRKKNVQCVPLLDFALCLRGRNSDGNIRCNSHSGSSFFFFGHCRIFFYSPANVLVRPSVVVYSIVHSCHGEY